MTPATATPMRTRTGPIPAHTHEPAIRIAGRLAPRYDEILTPEALAFLAELHDRFGARRHDRLADRMRRRFEIDGRVLDAALLRTAGGHALVLDGRA